MEIRSSEDGLGCQSVYRVLGILNADASFYSTQNWNGEEFNFDAVLVGSGALAVHADRHNIAYTTDTKDIDLYTTKEHADLDKFLEMPLAHESREGGSELRYNADASSSGGVSTEAFIDTITDYDEAFAPDKGSYEELEQMLQQDFEGDPIMDDTITVYLSSLESLRTSFQEPGQTYPERIELIDRMLER